MAEPQSDLIDLAAIVADGDKPDWERAASSADSDRARSIVEHLREIADVGRLHAAVSPGVADGTYDRLEPGATWGPLEILEHVGSGRFGDVYRAFDPGLHRDVALKLLRARDGEPGDDAFVVHEGRLAARVRHPNVVTVHGAQRIGDRTGVWMEFVVGRTLDAELAADGPYDAAKLAHVATDLCGALAAVHDAGLVHRDVKASNVMRDAEDRLVLGDFGTGRELIEGDNLRTGLAGTPAYIAPEIFLGAPATVQSDLYSFGVLLFHLATNDFPIRGRSLSDVRSVHASGEARKVRDLRPDLDRRLADVIDRALSPDPASRFASAATMTRALEQCTPASRTRRRRLVLSAVAAGAVAVASAAFWLMPRPQPVPSLGPEPWVLIGQFENQIADPALAGQVTAAFDGSLRTLMSANIVSRERVRSALSLMVKASDAPLDPFTAREVALRDGAVGAIISGRIERIGEVPRLTLQIVRPSDGSVAATLQESIVSSAMLEAAVHRASMRIRQSLRETRGSLVVPGPTLEKVTTPSLQALTLYSQAIRSLTPEQGTRRPAGTWPIAEALLRDAVAKDPDFAAAQMALATCSPPSLQSEGKPRAERALELSRLRTETERYGVMGSYHKVHGYWESEPAASRAHYIQAAAAFREVLRREPGHFFSLMELGDTYEKLGSFVEAAQVYMRLADQRRNTFAWQIRAAQAHASAGDFATAEKIASIAQDRLTPADYEGDPGGPVWILLVPAHRAWLQNQPGEARHSVDRVAALLDKRPDSFQYAFRTQLVHIYLALGRLDDAEKIAREAPASLTLRMLAPVLSERGDFQALRQLIAASNPDERWAVPSFLIESGSFSDARAAIAGFRRQNAPATIASADLYEGSIAIEEGRFAQAAVLLRRAVNGPPTGPNQWRKSRKLAEALLGLGDNSGAIAVLEPGTSAPRFEASVGIGGYEWIRMRAALADAYRRVGRIADAEAVEAELRTLLAEADEDHPLKMKLRRPPRP